MVNDIDEKGAAQFLVDHHVPFIGPDMGVELIKIVKRLEVVSTVYPLPPTVEAYRLSLHLMLQVAAQHQEAFCTFMEGVMADDLATQISTRDRERIAVLAPVVVPVELELARTVAAEG